MGILEEVIKDDVQTDLYLSEVATLQFRKDVLELIREYSNDGVIDKAIQMLESCKNK